MTAQVRKSTPARRVRRSCCALVGALVLLGACSSDGTGSLGGIDATLPSGDGDAGELAPEPEPEPAPEPEPEQPPVESPDDGDSSESETGGMTTGQWLTLILVGLGFFAVIAGVMSSAPRRSGKKQARQGADRRSAGEIVGLSRWLVDQGSIDVMRATDRQQLDVAWQSVSARAVDLENRCQALAGGADQPNLSEALRTLSVSVASLRGALEVSVQLREDPNATEMQHLIDENSNTISHRRQDVQLATDTLAHVMA